MIFQRLKETAGFLLQTGQILLGQTFKLVKGQALLFQSQIHRIIVQAAILVFQPGNSVLVFLGKGFHQLKVVLGTLLHLTQGIFCLTGLLVKVRHNLGQALFYPVLDVGNIGCGGLPNGVELILGIFLEAGNLLQKSGLDVLQPVAGLTLNACNPLGKA